MSCRRILADDGNKCHKTEARCRDMENSSRLLMEGMSSSAITLRIFILTERITVKSVQRTRTLYVLR